MALGRNQYRYLRYTDGSRVLLSEGIASFPDINGVVRTIEDADAATSGQLLAIGVAQWATPTPNNQRLDPDLFVWSAALHPTTPGQIVLVTNTPRNFSEIRETIDSMMRQIQEKVPSIDDVIRRVSAAKNFQDLADVIPDVKLLKVLRDRIVNAGG